MIMIDEAPTLKRFHARAKGRGNRIVKRNSHITVMVGDGKKRVTNMGQKVNPIGIRLGITRDWTSQVVCVDAQLSAHVHTDFLVREFLQQEAGRSLGQPDRRSSAPRARSTSRFTRHVRAS